MVFSKVCSPYFFQQQLKKLKTIWILDFFIKVKKRKGKKGKQESPSKHRANIKAYFRYCHDREVFYYPPSCAGGSGILISPICENRPGHG